MANFPTGKSYNYAWQNSKFAGVTYSGSSISQFTNDAGYITSASISSSASSSYATSASYALTASYALNGGGGGSVDTSSLVTTSSFNQFTSSYYLNSASFSSSIASLTVATSSYVLVSQTSSMTVLSASYALTASYALNGGGGGASFPYTGSAIISGSLTVTGSSNLPSITGSLLGTSSYALTASYAQNAVTTNGSFGVTFDGNGANLIVGTKIWTTLTNNGTITGWTLLADNSGSCTIDIWKSTFANFPPTASNSITSTFKPTISGSLTSQSLSIPAQWTSSFNSGDVMLFYVSESTSVTKINLTVKYQYN